MSKIPSVHSVMRAMMYDLGGKNHILGGTPEKIMRRYVNLRFRSVNLWSFPVQLYLFNVLHEGNDTEQSGLTSFGGEFWKTYFIPHEGGLATPYGVPNENAFSWEWLRDIQNDCIIR